jgi:predicted transcriptional regulator
MTVKHLLEQKGRNLWTIDPDATVLDALAKMAEKDIGSLVVMDGEELIGIITERHYSRKCHSQRQKVPYDAGQGYHGEKRSPCPARTVGRGMHGPDDR